MASDKSFVEYVAEQLSEAGNITYKKMFGEYMIYVNAIPAVLLCDNTVFVKINPSTSAVLPIDNIKGYPYTGAKEHFIIDPDDKETLVSVARAAASSYQKKK